MKKLIFVCVSVCLCAFFSLTPPTFAGISGVGGLGANVGTGAGQVYRDNAGGTLNFKTIKSAGGISVTNNANDVTLQVSGAGTGNVTGPAPTVAGTIALTLATDGTTLQNATGTGIVKATSGVYSTVSPVGVSDGGTNSSTALNSNRFMVSSSGAVVEASAVTASRAVASDANGLPTASTTTATELAFVHGVTSAIQTQLGLLAPLASPTFSGTASIASATVSGDVKKGNCYVTPKESDLGNSGSAVTIDLSTATVFTTTLNAATPTVTISNPVAGCAYAWIFTQDGVGSRVPTFAGTTIIWGSGTNTLSTAVNAVDKISCVYNGNISKLMCDLGTAYQ